MSSLLPGLIVACFERSPVAGNMTSFGALGICAGTADRAHCACHALATGGGQWTCTNNKQGLTFDLWFENMGCEGSIVGCGLTFWQSYCIMETWIYIWIQLSLCEFWSSWFLVFPSSSSSNPPPTLSSSDEAIVFPAKVRLLVGNWLQCSFHCLVFLFQSLWSCDRVEMHWLAQRTQECWFFRRICYRCADYCVRSLREYTLMCQRQVNDWFSVFSRGSHFTEVCPNLLSGFCPRGS